MSLKLTKIEGVPDRAQCRPGMAFFSDTGPFCTTCGECKHRGYWRQTERENKKTGEWETKPRRHMGCAQYHKLSGRHGPPVEPQWPSCKFFERAASNVTR